MTLKLITGNSKVILERDINKAELDLCLGCSEISIEGIDFMIVNRKAIIGKHSSFDGDNKILELYGVHENK